MHLHNFLLRDTDIPVESRAGYNTHPTITDDGTRNHGYGYYELKPGTKNRDKAQKIRNEIALFFQTPQGRYRKRGNLVLNA